MERTTAELVEKIHAIVFELLCDVDDYCRANGIPYYLSGGSCRCATAGSSPGTTTPTS